MKRRYHYQLILIMLLIISPASAREFLVVSLSGEMGTINESHEYRSIIHGAPFNKYEIQDAILTHDTTLTLYATVMARGLMKIEPFAQHPVYEKVEGGENAYFLIQEAGSLRPVFKNFSQNDRTTRAAKQERRELDTIIGKARVRKEYGRDQLFFPHLRFTPNWIPGSMLTSKEMMNAHPGHAKMLKQYSNDSWVLEGQSGTMNVYGRVFNRKLAPGEVYRNQLLIHEMANDRWRLFTVDEYMRIYVYDKICFMKGEMNRKDEKGVTHQKDNGNFYYYLPGEGELKKITLDPRMRVCAATDSDVILEMFYNLYLLSYDAKGLGKLSQFTNISLPIYPYWVFPLN